MNDQSQQKLQKALDSLMASIELWAPVLEETKKMHRYLEQLPVDLLLLQGQINKLSQASDRVPQVQKEKIQQLQGLESKLQALMNTLTTELPHLVQLEKKIGNLIALRERIEALQEQNQIRAKNYIN